MGMLFEKAGRHYLIFGVVGFLTTFLLFGGLDNGNFAKYLWLINSNVPVFLLIAVVITYPIARRTIYKAHFFMSRLFWSVLLWQVTVILAGALRGFFDKIYPQLMYLDGPILQQAMQEALAGGFVGIILGLYPVIILIIPFVFTAPVALDTAPKEGLFTGLVSD